MSPFKIAICSSIALFAGLAHAENLVLNGSFEEGKLVPDFEPGYMLVKPGSSLIPDWTVIGGTIGIAGEGHRNVPAIYGERFVDLTGITRNPQGYGIQQTINTVAGMYYTLGFDIGNSTLPDYGAISSLMATAGNTSQIFTHTGNDGVNSWRHFSMGFLATGAKTDISFVSKASANYIGLDNVSVISAVPEPQTYGMLLGGLGMIGFALSRRKKSK